MSAIIFDLETVKQDDDMILANAPKWDIEEAKTRVPKNYKKEDAINGWLEEDRDNHQKNLLEKAALNPETATVAIFGMFGSGTIGQLAVEDSPLADLSVITFPTEKKLIMYAIQGLLDHLKGGDNLIGWNILGFDLPFLIRRAWILGIKVPRHIYSPLDRYPVSDKFVDMMKVWQAGNYRAPFTSLNNALKAVGLPGKPDGSAFAEMWSTDKAKALNYNSEELRGQCALYRKMGVDL